MTVSRAPLLGTSAAPLVDVHDVGLLDLDGVVYVGPASVPGAVQHIASARAAGMHLGYVTNNAARTPGEVADHLRDLGIAVDDADVVTSAQAAARLVAGRVPTGSSVLVVGGNGLVQALAEHGLTAVDSADDKPAAVVQGFHPDIGWRLLAEGAYAVAAGLPWIASNLDRTVPTDRGQAPGNGTLVAAVQAATGVQPVVAGKPEPALIEESVLRTGAQRPLMVGDRLDSDISGARRFGMPSLLVLTGVTSIEQLLAAQGEERPDFVAADLSGLLLAHPVVLVDDASARCDGWTARVVAGRLSVRRDGPHQDHVGTVAALRAAVTVAWAAHDTGGDDLDTSGAVEQLHEMMVGDPAETET